MSSRSDKPPIDEADAAAYWRAASTGYHRLSSFGAFPEPQPPYAPAAAEPGIGSSMPATPLAQLDAPFAELLRKRTSDRNFGEGNVGREAITSMLWATYGRVSGPTELDRRTVPSGGALYPLRVILVALAIEDVARGAYRFEPNSGDLTALPDVVLPAEIADWFRTKHVDFARTAAIAFFVGRLDRSCPQYGERGYRYILLEAGHAAQNLCLAATAFAVPHLPLGGFLDNVVGPALRVAPRREAVVYSVVLGKRR